MSSHLYHMSDNIHPKHHPKYREKQTAARWAPTKGLVAPLRATTLAGTRMQSHAGIRAHATWPKANTQDRAGFARKNGVATKRPTAKELNAAGVPAGGLVSEEGDPAPLLPIWKGDPTQQPRASRERIISNQARTPRCPANEMANAMSDTTWIQACAPEAPGAAGALTSSPGRNPSPNAASANAAAAYKIPMSMTRPFDPGQYSVVA